MQYGAKIAIWREQRARSTEQQARVDENFRTATELCRKEQNGRNILSGNSLKGSNIKLKKKRNPCGREKGCWRGRETTNFFYLA